MCRMGCPCEYEEQLITYTVRHKGKIVVIDCVPALVCPICGDVLLAPETLKNIEKILQTHHPERTVPLYEYELKKENLNG